ncbi:MAG: hypothetical protein COA78_06655 [Blastopirellula sp.]|nr:MAG: hypothetical protein COA78_06655 [Blastopirellula sp.]
METIKTASMVIVLMAVGYGVYTVLNQSQPTPSDMTMSGGLDIEMPDIASGNTPQMPTIEPIEVDGSTFAPAYTSSANADPTASAPGFNSLPGGPVSALPNTEVSAATASTPLPVFDNTTPANPALNESTLTIQPNSNPPLYGNTQASLNNPPLGITAISASRQFDLDWRSAELLLEKQEMFEALRSLSKWKNHPELTSVQTDQLNRLLSQLAGSVVYSTDHLMRSPHIVTQGETLKTIASKFQISPVLLQRINGLTATQILLSGQRLKVMQGPFAAKLDLTHNELVLSVDGCYAGRFPLSVANEAAVQTGNFSLIRKEENPDFYDATKSQVLTSTDPGNPFGKYRMHLDGGMSIHGTQAPTGGSISLSPRDIEDVFSILTVGSRVEVVR